jgi:hypothetical protein
MRANVVNHRQTHAPIAPRDGEPLTNSGKPVRQRPWDAACRLILPLRKETLMASNQYETRAAFHELLDLLKDIDQKFFEGPCALTEEADVLDGYKWIPTLLQVALDAHVWADDNKPTFVEIVGPYKKWGGDNSDAFYYFAPIDPNRTYRVRGHKGEAAYLSLTVYGGPRDGRYSDRIVGTINDRSMTIGPGGNFEIILSPNQHPGNWLKLEPDAVCAITRDYMTDPVKGRRAAWSIEATEPVSPRRPTDTDMAARFRAAATFIRDQLSYTPLVFPPANTIQDPFPVPTVTRGWAAGDASYAMGSFDLEDDQALVIKGRSPACAFWNLCLWNPFLHTYDYRYERVTINGGQTTYAADGSWTIVVSKQDPGVANWLSTAGRRRGLIWFRWFLPEETPKPIEAKVVSLSELAG